MKPVERYRAALDEIKAPDALKEKLLAVPTQVGGAQSTPIPLTDAPSAAQGDNTTAQKAHPKKAIHFVLPQNWKKYALTAAACFMIGVLTNDALGLQLIPQISVENTAVTSVADEESHLGSAVALVDERTYDAAMPAENEASPAAMAEDDTPARSVQRSAAPVHSTLSRVALPILLIFSGAALALGSIFVYDRIKQKHPAS